MLIPNVKGFSAWINTMPMSPHELIVVGKVETNAGNLVPKLVRAEPQGINPSILILDLIIETVGDLGTSDVAYRDARFSEAAGTPGKAQVDIRWQGDIIQSMPVSIVS